MTKILCVFGIICLILITTSKGNSAENSWIPLNNLNINMGRSVNFVKKKTGWAVGNRYGEGLIYQTMDGGKTWEKQESGTENPLYDVFFTDSYNGWAVGFKGTILHTYTGGLKWSKQRSGLEPEVFGRVPISIILNSVYFVNNKEGWIAADSAILHTENGGITWERQYFGTRFGLLRIFFIDSQNGWAVGYNGVILHTTSGGKRRFGGLLSGWSEQDSGVGEHLFDVFFIDKDYGWAVSANSILHTDNGGQSWTVQCRRLARSLCRIYFIDHNRGWAIGAGKILYTTNGGKAWQIVDLGHNYNLAGISFAENTGWIIGEHGILLRYSQNTLP